MVKTALVTSLYVSAAWTLLVSYQLFTLTAVTTIITHVNMIWPSVGAWLSLKTDMLVFIYAFAWIFLLSSVIPSVMLGKERSVLTQFFVCLTLTFVAFVVQDYLINLEGSPIDQLSILATVFHNPLLAAAYLLTPYLLMLTLDLRSRKLRKRKEALKKIIEDYSHNEVADKNTQQSNLPQQD